MKNAKTYLDVKTAKQRAERYCAYQERHQQEVRDKLYEWGLKTEDVENLIAFLVSEDFLNEERFARAYARGKFRIKKWGKLKIKSELKKRKISDYSIRKGLAEIDEQEYILVLKHLIFKKNKEFIGKTTPQKLFKIQRFLTSKGYEQDLIWELLQNLKD